MESSTAVTVAKKKKQAFTEHLLQTRHWAKGVIPLKKKKIICLCQVFVAAYRIFFFKLWHVGSVSLTRDQTQAPCIRSMES